MDGAMCRRPQWASPADGTRHTVLNLTASVRGAIVAGPLLAPVPARASVISSLWPPAAAGNRGRRAAPQCVRARRLGGGGVPQTSSRAAIGSAHTTLAHMLRRMSLR